MKLKGERWRKSSFAVMPGAMPRSFKEAMPKKLCYVSKLSGAKLGKNKVGGQVAILPPFASGATVINYRKGSIFSSKLFCHVSKLFWKRKNKQLEVWQLFCGRSRFCDAKL